MRNHISQLFRPLQFLRVRNSSKNDPKVLYQIVLPFGFTIIIFFLQFYKQESVDILEYNGFIAKIILILQILAPFTLAALAAVATFPSDIMDAKISGNKKSTLRRKLKGEYIIEELTRRRYLSLLFGYITLLGMIMLLVGTILPDIIRLLRMVPIFSQVAIDYITLSIFAFMSGNLLTNTLHGLFYLSDRIHRKN